MAAQPTPRGLKAGGKKLWTKITEDYDLRADELAILTQACATIDTIEAIQKAHDQAGNPLLATGSMGQETVHPYLTELRAQRAQLTRLLSTIGIPDATGGDGPGTDASAAGANLVQLRWGKRGA